MLLTFGDESTLAVEYIGRGVEIGNTLEITVKTDNFNAVRAIFLNKDKLSTITTETGEIYNNYSSLKCINANTLDDPNLVIMYITLRYAELDDVVDKLKAETDRLKASNDDLNKQVSDLTECVLEMSELLYS